MRLGQGSRKAQNDIPFSMEGWTLRLATIVPQIVQIITTKYSQSTPDIHVLQVTLMITGIPRFLPVENSIGAVFIYIHLLVLKASAE